MSEMLRIGNERGYVQIEYEAREKQIKEREVLKEEEIKKNEEE